MKPARNGRSDLRSISVILMDLDGTLLRSDGTISARSIETLSKCRAAGIRIAIATARAPRTVSALLPPSLLDLPWICYGGAEICENGNRIYRNLISPPSARSLISWLTTYFPYCKISVETENQLFANGHLEKQWAYQIVNLMTVVDQPVTKILVDLDHVDDPEFLLGNIPDDCKIVVDRDNLGQILASTVSKTAALKFILDRWGLKRENVIAFGDDTMDIDVIRDCGIGVAMGNAIPEVKAVANLVTTSNDEDGVAEVLEKMFLR